MAQFSFKRHHDANILNDKHVVCTVKCWRHGCNHVVVNVKLGHAAVILNRLLRLCLCLCLCWEFAKSLISHKNVNKSDTFCKLYFGRSCIMLCDIMLPVFIFYIQHAWLIHLLTPCERTPYFRLNSRRCSRKNKSAWWIFTQFYFRDSESWLNC